MGCVDQDHDCDENASWGATASRSSAAGRAHHHAVRNWSSRLAVYRRIEIKVGGPKSLVRRPAETPGSPPPPPPPHQITTTTRSWILARRLRRTRRSSWPATRCGDWISRPREHPRSWSRRSPGEPACCWCPEDLTIFQLSDRVAVMYEGTFMGISPVGEVGLETDRRHGGAARLGVKGGDGRDNQTAESF